MATPQYISGTAGRVATGSGHVAIAGIKLWKLPKSVTMIPTPHFELTADANGTVWNDISLKGLAQATVDIDGWFDIANNTEATLATGVVVLLDLLFDKNSSFGYIGLNGTVMEVGPGTNVENQAGVFSCKVQLTGVVPTAS